MNDGTWERVTFSSWVYTTKPVVYFIAISNPSIRVKLIKFLIHLLRVKTVGIIHRGSTTVSVGNDYE